MANPTPGNASAPPDRDQMVRAERAALLIPALNEGEVISRVLEAVPRHLFAQIIVVDNGSTDDTAAKARQAGVEVLRQPARGYGRACLLGLAHLRPEIDCVVFMDADFSDDPAEAEQLLDKLREGYDLVIGSRVARAQANALSPHQKFGNSLATWLIARTWHVQFSDLGPFRAVRRGALDAMQMCDQNYGWTIEMQAQAARLHLRCAEIDVSYRPRAAGQSKVSGTWKGSILAGAKILWTYVLVACQNRSADPG